MGPQFATLLTTFAVAARDQLQQARCAHQAKDSEALLNVVHRLKNTGATLARPTCMPWLQPWNRISRGVFPVGGIDRLEQTCQEAAIAAERLLDEEHQA